MADLNLISLDFGGLAKGFVEQVTPPEGQRAHPCHLRLVASLMGQQRLVVAVVRVDDDQALAGREASSEEQQASVKDHGLRDRKTTPGIKRFELHISCVNLCIRQKTIEYGSVSDGTSASHAVGICQSADHERITVATDRRI